MRGGSRLGREGDGTPHPSFAQQMPPFPKGKALGKGVYGSRPVIAGAARSEAERAEREAEANVIFRPVRPPWLLCGDAVLYGTGTAQGRRGFQREPDRFARPRTHEQEDLSVLLFVSVFSFPPLRRRLFFGKTKKSGGRNSWESPGPLAGSNGRIQKSAPTASSVHRSDGDRIPPPPAGRRSAVSLPGQNFAALYR